MSGQGTSWRPVLPEVWTVALSWYCSAAGPVILQPRGKAAARAAKAVVLVMKALKRALAEAVVEVIAQAVAEEGLTALQMYRTAVGMSWQYSCVAAVARVAQVDWLRVPACCDRMMQTDTLVEDSPGGGRWGDGGGRGPAGVRVSGGGMEGGRGDAELAVLVLLTVRVEGGDADVAVLVLLTARLEGWGVDKGVDEAFVAAGGGWGEACRGGRGERCEDGRGDGWGDGWGGGCEEARGGGRGEDCEGGLGVGFGERWAGGVPPSSPQLTRCAPVLVAM